MDAFACQGFGQQRLDVTILKQTIIVEGFVSRQPLLVVVGRMIYEVVEAVA